MSGKGDTPRPMSVSQQEYASNYDRIFKSKVTDDKAPTDSDTNDAPTADDSSKAVSAEDRQRYYSESYSDPLRQRE